MQNYGCWRNHKVRYLSRQTEDLPDTAMKRIMVSSSFGCVSRTGNGFISGYFKHWHRFHLMPGTVC